MKELIEQYKILHGANEDYGASAYMYFDSVKLCIEELKPKTALDFGCGKGALLKMLLKQYADIKILGYDPAIPGKETIDLESFDFIYCVDVLEHIPEEELPRVVEKISKLSENVFFVLHHAPAAAVLPNGENAHCTVRNLSWYMELLGGRFKYLYTLPSFQGHLTTVVTFKFSREFYVSYMEGWGAAHLDKVNAKLEEVNAKVEELSLKTLPVYKAYSALKSFIPKPVRALIKKMWRRTPPVK